MAEVKIIIKDGKEGLLLEVEADEGVFQKSKEDLTDAEYMGVLAVKFINRTVIHRD